MILPATSKLHEITREETERISYKATQFVVGRMKFFPFLHLKTLADRDIIPLPVYKRIDTLLFRFEVNFYLKISDLLYKAFRSGAFGVDYPLALEENMNEILRLMTDYDLIYFPINSETWKMRVEYKPDQNGIILSEFSHGRLDHEARISL